MSQDTSMLYQRSLPVPEGITVDLLLQKWNPGVEDHVLADMLVTVLRWNNLSSFEQIQPNQEVLLPTIVPPNMTPRQWRESQPDRPKRKPFQVGQSKFDTPSEPSSSPAAPMSVAPPAAARPAPSRTPAPAPASVPPRPGTGKFPAPAPSPIPPRPGTGKFPAPAPASVPPRPGTGKFSALAPGPSLVRPGTGKFQAPMSQGPARPMMPQSISSTSLLELKARQASGGLWQASNQPGQVMGGSDVKEQFQKMMQEEIWKKRKMTRPFA